MGKVESINGYAILKLDVGNQVQHYMYLRPAGKARILAKNKYDPNLTIFCDNVPADATQESIRALFVRCGAINAVRLVSRQTDGGDVEGIADDYDLNEAGPSNRQPKAIKQTTQEESVAHLPGFGPDYLDNRPMSGRSAFVNFIDSASCHYALDKLPKQSWPYQGAQNGRERLLKRHAQMHPTSQAVKAFTDTYMADWDTQVNARKTRNIMAMYGVKDQLEEEFVDKMTADGFTMVARTASNRFGRTGSGDNAVGIAPIAQSIKASDVDDYGRIKSRKTKAPKDLRMDNFYRFQKQDQKKQELVQMRLDFEDAKKKVLQLKQRRNFKPF